MNRALFSAPISEGRVPVDLLPDGGKYPWVVEEDQWYLWTGFGPFAPCVIPLPRAYRTDGPSIPWFAQGVVRKDGPVWPAALFHDVGCSAELFPVGTVNAMMGDAMHDYGVDERTRDRVELAVGAFCWITFASHKRREVEADRRLVVEASKRIWREHAPRFEGFGRIEEIAPELR
jgi:hypothetical protein